MEMNHKLQAAISASLVGCMIVVASEGLFQGNSPSEIHLITSAPLASGSSVTGSAIDFVQHNTLTEAIHMASVPEESELRLGGLVKPSV